MTRPCFLVIDREFAGSISTRKLVIETAKFNVITAYSSEEAIEVLIRFPAVDGAVVDVGVDEMNCDDLIRRLKVIKPGLPVIAIVSLRNGPCDAADHQLESFEPAPLLELLRTLKTEACNAIERNEERLHDQGK